MIFSTKLHYHQYISVDDLFESLPPKSWSLYLYGYYRTLFHDACIHGEEGCLVWVVSLCCSLECKICTHNFIWQLVPVYNDFQKNECLYYDFLLFGSLSPLVLFFMCRSIILFVLQFVKTMALVLLFSLAHEPPCTFCISEAVSFFSFGVPIADVSFWLWTLFLDSCSS